MAKKRTRAQKIKAAGRDVNRPAGTNGFKVSFIAMDGAKINAKHVAEKQIEHKYFAGDLTKVAILTMLALALELLLWRYLPR